MNTTKMQFTLQDEFDITIPRTINLAARVRVKPDLQVVLVDGVPMVEHADTIDGVPFPRCLFTMPQAIERGWVEVLEQEEATVTTRRIVK